MLSFLDSPRGAGWTISWVVLRQEVFLLSLEFCSQGGTPEQPALVWTAEGQGHAGGAWSRFPGASGLDLGAQFQPTTEWYFAFFSLC